MVLCWRVMSPPSWCLRVYVICWDAQGEIDEPLKIVFSLTQNNDSSLSLDGGLRAGRGGPDGVWGSQPQD